MINYRSLNCVLFCLGIFAACLAIVQVEGFELTSKGDTIQNTIDIQISASNYEKIKK
jgi:hypothetical protein